MSDATDALNAIELLRAILSQVQTEKRHYMAENAMLRELVRDMYEMAYPECPSAFEASFADRMRELGVEA